MEKNDPLPGADAPNNMRKKGLHAEDMAADYLIKQGVTLITRRHGEALGEIDLIGLEGEELVFFEVKLRKESGHAEESIGRLKWERLNKAARKYLLEIDESNRKYHFELVAVSGEDIRRYVFDPEAVVPLHFEAREETEEYEVET